MFSEEEGEEWGIYVGRIFTPVLHMTKGEYFSQHFPNTFNPVFS
jgi:hypothetical protein